VLYFKYTGKTGREESKSPFKEFHLLKYGSRRKNLWENLIILTERWHHSKSRPEMPTETIKYKK